jgi:uncharacterized protein (DUF2235 family)
MSPSREFGALLQGRSKREFGVRPSRVSMSLSSPEAVPSRAVEFLSVQAVRDFTVHGTADRRTLNVQLRTATPLQTRRVDLFPARSECPLALWKSNSFLAASYARSPAVSPDNSIARLITSSAEGVSRSSLLLLLSSRWPPWRLSLTASFDLLLFGDAAASALGSDVF